MSHDYEEAQDSVADAEERLAAADHDPLTMRRAARDSIKAKARLLAQVASKTDANGYQNRPRPIDPNLFGPR